MTGSSCSACRFREASRSGEPCSSPRAGSTSRTTSSATTSVEAEIDRLRVARDARRRRADGAEARPAGRSAGRAVGAARRAPDAAARRHADRRDQALDPRAPLQRRMGAVGAARGAGAPVRRDGGRVPARAQGRPRAGRRAPAAACWRAAATAPRRCWRAAVAPGADCAARIRWCWWPTTSRRPTCCSSSASVFTGFVTDVGGKTSHTAIVARSMDIPAVVGAREASRLIRQDDWVVIDGDAGIVIVDPSPIGARRIPASGSARASSSAPAVAGCGTLPAVTLDGERSSCSPTSSSRATPPAALEAGAVGRRPVPQRVPVHEPRRRAARRGRAVRGLSHRRRGDAAGCR